MIFITGDTHGDFGRVAEFCERIPTEKEDVLIILGDAGINYYGGEHDQMTKEFLESLPITIFAIYGNHEMRPQSIPTYHEAEWCGGTVFAEDEYPHILFAKPCMKSGCGKYWKSHGEKELKWSSSAHLAAVRSGTRQWLWHRR